MVSQDIQAINRLRESGNLWGRELLQVDPAAAARINAWAEETGMALNWNLPLKPNIMAKSSGDITIVRQELEEIDDAVVTTYTAVPNASASRNLIYYFTFASYLTRITATVRGLKLAPPIFGIGSLAVPAFTTTGRAPGPDPAYQSVINPCDYIEVKIRRLNTENVTIADNQQDFLALSAIAGDGKSPYATDLTLPFRQAENLIVEVRVTPEVLSVNNVEIELHFLRLPVGMMVRGPSGQ
jgi:hypothetical protein